MGPDHGTNHHPASMINKLKNPHDKQNYYNTGDGKTKRKCVHNNKYVVTLVCNVKWPKSKRRWLSHLEEAAVLMGTRTFGASRSISRANLRIMYM